MKSKEELFSLKSEVELLNNKLCELSDDELAQVVGGIKFASPCGAQVLFRRFPMFDGRVTMSVREDVACGFVVDQKLSDIID